MADQTVSMSIGVPGQPALTVYNYEAGAVTLNARADTTFTVGDLEGALTQIDLFCRAVTNGQTPPRTPTPVQFMSRALDDSGQAGRIVLRYRAGPLIAEADYVFATDTMHFSARDAATVPWSDFLRFVAWLKMIVADVRA